MEIWGLHWLGAARVLRTAEICTAMIFYCSYIQALFKQKQVSQDAAAGSWLLKVVPLYHSDVSRQMLSTVKIINFPSDHHPNQDFKE